MVRNLKHLYTLVHCLFILSVMIGCQPKANKINKKKSQGAESPAPEATATPSATPTPTPTPTATPLSVNCFDPAQVSFREVDAITDLVYPGELVQVKFETVDISNQKVACSGVAINVEVNGTNGRLQLTPTATSDSSSITTATDSLGEVTFYWRMELPDVTMEIPSSANSISISNPAGLNILNTKTLLTKVDLQIAAQFSAATADSIQEVFRESLNNWRIRIPKKLPNVRLVPNGSNVDVQVTGGEMIGLSNCGLASLGSTFDFADENIDMLIFIEEKSTDPSCTAFCSDGEGGTLASAAPMCARKLSTGEITTIFGFIAYDPFDVNPATLASASGRQDVVNILTHEIGHVLGVGTWWEESNLLANPSCIRDDSNNLVCSPTDPIFLGTRTISAYNQLLSAIGQSSTTQVPVANCTFQAECDFFGSGSLDSHWREDVFEDELMTPFIDFGIDSPLSIVTSASLFDLGYPSANTLITNDNYLIPFISEPFTLDALLAPPPENLVIANNSNGTSSFYLKTHSGSTEMPCDSQPMLASEFEPKVLNFSKE